MTPVVRRVWRVLALPLISIVLSVIVGSLVIILSQWLVAGELEPGLAFDAYAALISVSIGTFNSIVNTLVAATPGGELSKTGGHPVRAVRPTHLR